VDASVQELQGKAERVKPTDLVRLLDEFYREKAALRERHAAAARAVGQYDINNAYQYVIAREDQHLSWIADALCELGAPVPDASAAPDVSPAKSLEAQQSLAGEDARGLDEFAVRWKARVPQVSNARNRLMLQLVLGEVLEQVRFFRQAAGGRLDLLGRRTGGERTKGEVLPTRWVE
jgi:hypothetical protein